MTNSAAKSADLNATVARIVAGAMKLGMITLCPIDRALAGLPVVQEGAPYLEAYDLCAAADRRDLEAVADSAVALLVKLLPEGSDQRLGLEALAVAAKMTAIEMSAVDCDPITAAAYAAGVPSRVAGETEDERLDRVRGSYWLSDW
jgi:hypothetical protein